MRLLRYKHGALQQSIKTLKTKRKLMNIKSLTEKYISSCFLKSDKSATISYTALYQHCVPAVISDCYSNKKRSTYAMPVFNAREVCDSFDRVLIT